MEKRDNTNKLYNDIRERNFSYALTLIYFSLNFIITFFLNFVYLFKSRDYFVLRFAFVVIISAFAYYFMAKHFIKFLDKTEIGEDLDFFNSTAVTLSTAIFILNSMVMFFIFLMMLYIIGVIFSGIMSGEFSTIHNFI